MTSLDLSQIRASRFRTSAEADRNTVALMHDLGLSTKANVARLAIARSLALGALGDVTIDSKGLDIPAQALFTQSDVPVWVGLIVTHARRHESDIRNMESFRNAVRQHWHRGISLLMNDWRDSKSDYDAFVATLINRRAELPDEVISTPLPARNERPEISAEDVSKELLKAIEDIGVVAEIKGVKHGPRVSRYKVFLPDINLFDKLKKGLERINLHLNLGSSPSISQGDEAKTVFLDLPRSRDSWSNTGFLRLKEWVAKSKAKNNELIVYPGVNVLGDPFFFDLAKAPHLFVGGATGMGKSVTIHSIILSLILFHKQSNIKIALIDTKKVEFAVYENSEHLYEDGIAYETSSARVLLDKLISEMEDRYENFSSIGVTNIFEARERGLDLPYIVVFIEEMADLIMQDKKTEDSIIRLAQKARASGIHLVLATQRPEAKTFSGLIRSNVPSRIALKVQKSSESNIILDESGAEDLLGAGDMLIKIPGLSERERVHGVYISRQDIESVIKNKI